MKIKPDKVSHYFTCYAICLSLCFIMPVMFAVITALAIGAAKELLYDQKLGRGVASWGDMAANCAGAVSAAVFYLIFSGGCV